jgi:hypothetical protein
MDRAAMRAAERDGEFVARFAAERPWLQVAKMLRIGLFAPADETRLLGDITKVLRVTIAPQFRSNEHALFDAVRPVGVAVSLGGRCMGANKTSISTWSIIVCGFRSCGWCDLGQPVFKGVLHKLGIGCREVVLGGERLTRPSRGKISRCDVA